MPNVGIRQRGRGDMPEYLLFKRSSGIFACTP